MKYKKSIEKQWQFDPTLIPEFKMEENEVNPSPSTRSQSPDFLNLKKKFKIFLKLGLFRAFNVHEQTLILLTYL